MKITINLTDDGLLQFDFFDLLAMLMKTFVLFGTRKEGNSVKFSSEEKGVSIEISK